MVDQLPPFHCPTCASSTALSPMLPSRCREAKLSSPPHRASTSALLLMVCSPMKSSEPLSVGHHAKLSVHHAWSSSCGPLSPSAGYRRASWKRYTIGPRRPPLWPHRCWPPPVVPWPLQPALEYCAAPELLYVYSGSNLCCFFGRSPVPPSPSNPPTWSSSCGESLPSPMSKESPSTHRGASLPDSPPSLTTDELKQPVAPPCIVEAAPPLYSGLGHQPEWS
jgi:hypothetical protein